MEGDVPTYQYACTACGHQLEAVQSFSDEPLTQCPVCGGKLRKVYSSVGIVFKGPGFYRTDSRRGEGTNGAKKDNAPAASSPGSDAKSGSATSTSGTSTSDSSTSGSTSSGSAEKSSGTKTSGARTGSRSRGPDSAAKKG
jgi:putative FmdB family regulatory protein